MFSTEDALLESFIENKQNAFLKYKENACVTRTLISEKFKSKYKTGNERKVEKIFKLDALDKKNKATVKRLQGELDILKTKKKALWQFEKEKFDPVLEVLNYKNEPEKVAKMLDLLPQTYKFDLDSSLSDDE